MRGFQEDLARGSHWFRYLFTSAGCKPVSGWSELVGNPRESVLVVLGQTAVLDHIPEGLVSYLEEGGSVLVATDRSTLSGPLKRFGVTIEGATLVVDGPDRYGGIADCPFVAPLLWDPFFSGTTSNRLGRVATNRPGHLELKGDSLNRYAGFPPSAVFKGQRAGAGMFYFAAGARFLPSGGRLLVLSDHSVFINGMLWQNDNDNLKFANNCVSWLTDGGRRRRIYFWDEGTAQSQLDLPLPSLPPPVPLPPPDVMVQIVDEGLEGLEHENRFNKLIAARSDEWSDGQNNPFAALLRGFLGVPSKESGSASLAVVFLGGSLVVGLFGCHWLSQARQRREPGLRSLDTALGDLPVGESLLSQRGRALASCGKFNPGPVEPTPRNSASGGT